MRSENVLECFKRIEAPRKYYDVERLSTIEAMGWND